jgi:hypothetical protein
MGIGGERPTRQLMVVRLAGVCALFLCGCIPASASLLDIGFIGILPAAGTYQGVVVANLTGQGCTNAVRPYALACGQYNIANWALDIYYTKLVNGTQVDQTASGPVVVSSATCGLPACDKIGSGNDYANEPLYALPFSVDNPAGFDTSITRIIFSGVLADSLGNAVNPVSVWNQGDTSPSIFQPPNPFSFDLDLTKTDYTSSGQFLTDLIISDAAAVAEVPEPSTLPLMLGGALVVLGSRRGLLRRANLRFLRPHNRP